MSDAEDRNESEEALVERLVWEYEAEIHRGRIPIFDPPGISTAWLIDDQHPGESRELDDCFVQAWDELCGSPEWRAWYVDHVAAFKVPDTFHYIQVDERPGGRRYRRGPKGLSAWVPMSEVRAADDRVEFMKSVLVEFFTGAATLGRFDPPPTS